MSNMLSLRNRSVLAQFAWANVLLAFDYDGTLAPIVPDPDRAEMRTKTRECLREVARRYPCVVISGRAKADVEKRVRGIGLRQVIGNHGVEPWQVSSHLMKDVSAWRTRLEHQLAGQAGVWIEDKAYSLAVHYRQSRARKAARAAIVAAASRLGDVRLIGGKLVINILASDAPHKGMALERVREKLSCDTALYVGDDETDEDVFALDQPGRLLTIRVGTQRGSQASYTLRNQREIDDLLCELLRLRDPRLNRPRELSP
jgi:trehalose 6-phosphate phosphatase